MKVQKRTIKGSKTRTLTKVPGVMYGSGFKATAIEATVSDLTAILREKGTSKTFEVSLDGKKHLVYLREYQTYRLNQHQFTHFDLVKVSKDDTMTSKIRLSLLNRELVEKKGLVIHMTLDAVKVEYGVGKGVSHIDLDVKDLEENDLVHVSDIKVPKGIKILDEPEEVVLSVVTPKEEVEVTDEDEEVTEVESLKQKDE